MRLIPLFLIFRAVRPRAGFFALGFGQWPVGGAEVVSVEIRAWYHPSAATFSVGTAIPNFSAANFSISGRTSSVSFTSW